MVSSLGPVADLVDRYGDEPFQFSPNGAAARGTAAARKPLAAAQTVAAASTSFPTYHETPKGTSER